jgi:hypothetical protein
VRPRRPARRAMVLREVVAVVSARCRFTVLVLPSGGVRTVQPKVVAGSFGFIGFVEWIT